MGPTWCIAVAMVLSCLGRAAAQSSYAGSYRASPLTTVAEVTTWGPDCGARPQSQVEKERPTVEVDDQGVQLTLTFPDRVLRTNACWSQNPAVKLKSAIISGAQWKVECATVPGDPKREIAHYWVVAKSPFVLELREESEYQWQLKDSRCIAKVRTTQKLERPEPGASPVAEDAPGAEEACTPGAVTRLRLRPSSARIAPGERICFSPRGSDAKGCSAEIDAKRVSFSVERPPGARGTMSGVCFKAGESAADAEGTFRVLASYEGLRGEASVVVTVPDLSDITARRSGSDRAPLGGDDSAQGAGLAGAGVKALGVRTDDILPWLLGLAGLTLAGGLLAWVALGRRRESVAPSSPSTPPAQRGFATSERPRPAAAATSPSEAPIPGTAQPLICPQCRRGFAPGTGTCSLDGTQLVPYAMFLKQAKASEETRKCPGCGNALLPDAMFCGECGRRL